MPRFFMKAPPQGGSITLTGEDARHIGCALRMQPGEPLTVCDGAGTDYACVLTAVQPAAVTARVLDVQPSAGEPDIQAALYMALPKADKMELIVQKATELGATEIVPFLSSRCVSRPERKALDKKCARWRKIAAEAAGQCGRGRIPAVRDCVPFETAVKLAVGAALPLMLYEAERENSLRAALTAAPLQTVSIMVGPEGGFSPEEVAQATGAGLRSVSLGTRILRCETAPLAALAAIMYQSGNL